MITAVATQPKPWLEEDWPKRIQYVLHLGLVEIRNLALAGKTEQIHDLADAMEILPQFIDDCDDDKYELIHFVLTKYQNQYHSTCNYPARLEQANPPEHY